MRRLWSGLVVGAGILAALCPCAWGGDRSGALGAFTSSDPVVVSARQLIDAGRLAGAEELLASQHSDNPEVQRARDETAELIRRIRIDYALDEQAMLARVKAYVPSVALQDLERWAGEGVLASRALDGRTRYFSLEPSNLLRFSAEVQTRRDREGGKSDTVATEDHPDKLCNYIRRVLAAAETSDSPEVMPVRFRIDYKIVIAANTPGVKPGSVISVWMPFPQRYGRQRDVRWIQPSINPGEPTPPSGVAPAGNDGPTRITGAPQRSQFFQKTVADPAQPTVFETTYIFRTSAHCPRLRDDLVRPLPGDWGNAYLNERPPHIVFTQDVRDLAGQIVGSETNPLARARLIYRWIGRNIQYCDEEEYSIIPSLTARCLSRRRGDCGVQAMTFITLCRTAGIPARWQSGWELWPGNVDLHDWAEFYVAPYGWLVADPTYIVRDETDPRVEEFYFGHSGAYRMIVNLDYGREFVPPKQSVRSEPLDFQRGEVEVDGQNLYFNHWTYEMKVQELD